ncbi:unnamed protein product [marine sediment metagenome]|uniref:Uncharacterized protein n=1 Tax=marine sediment metagenome TaxID=412755 RepID=X1V534_9ZZZZ
MSYTEKGYHRVNRIVATLLDGRTVAKGVTVHNCLPGETTISVEITIPNLNFIEEILNIQINAPEKESCPTWGHKNISDNVIGLTICGLADGITATVEAIAIGV